MNLKRHLDDDIRTDSAKRLKQEKHVNSNKSYFTLRRPEKYDINFPFFRQPKEIGCMSLDINRKFSNDKSQLKYYVKPSDMNNVNYDLKIGYNDMIRKDDNVKEYINDILRWINRNLEKFSLQNNKNNPEQESQEESDSHRYKVGMN